MSSRARSRSSGLTRISRGPNDEVEASAIATAKSVLPCIALIPSVASRAMISSAATAFATTVRRTGSGTAVQDYLPALDPHRRQHAIDPPRVGYEQIAHVLLRVRGDDVQRLALALERPAENDLALVDEAVHERGVLVPALLLAHAAAPVPRPAALEPEDVVVQLLLADDRLGALEILGLDEDLSRAAHGAAAADAPRSGVRWALHRLDALELEERLDLVGLDLVQHDCQP